VTASSLSARGHTLVEELASLLFSPLLCGLRESHSLALSLDFYPQTGATFNEIARSAAGSLSLHLVAPMASLTFNEILLFFSVSFVA